MIELAMCPEGASGRSIAENQHLPAAYLEQLMARLRGANLVTSIRGAKGKFILVGNAENINLAQIIQALDGPIEIADCKDVHFCSTDPSVCALREIFMESNAVLYKHLAGISLAELARRKRQEDVVCTLDYSI